MEDAAEELLEVFDAMDTDASGGLSKAEARVLLPGLTDEQFALLDADGNGEITLEELDAVLNPGCCGGQDGSDTGLLILGILAAVAVLIAGLFATTAA